jgi:hypothetical protein
MSKYTIWVPNLAIKRPFFDIWHYSDFGLFSAIGPTVLRYYGDRVMKVTHVHPNSGMIVRNGRPNRFPFLMQGSLLVGCLLATKAREHQVPRRGPCRGLNRVSQSYVTGSFAILDSYQYLSGFWWFWTPVAPKDIELKLMIFESLWALRSLERGDLTDRRFIVVLCSNESSHCCS